MVKSGLVKDPAVSHYRLTAHLALAITLYGLLLWTAFDLLLSLQERRAPEPLFIKWYSYLSCGAISLTILYGGLVAGLKAGLVYNTFPLMEGQFIPEEWSFFHPLWHNFLENPALVQWMHRWRNLRSAFLWSMPEDLTASPNETTRGLVVCGAAFPGLPGILTLLLHACEPRHSSPGTAAVLLSLGCICAI